MAVKNVSYNDVIKYSVANPTASDADLALQATYTIVNQVLDGLYDESLYPDIARNGRIGEVNSAITTAKNNIEAIYNDSTKSPEQKRNEIRAELDSLSKMKDSSGKKIFEVEAPKTDKNGVTTDPLRNADGTMNITAYVEMLEKNALDMVNAIKAHGQNSLEVKKLQMQRALIMHIIDIERANGELLHDSEMIKDIVTLKNKWTMIGMYSDITLISEHKTVLDRVVADAVANIEVGGKSLWRFYTDEIARLNNDNATLTGELGALSTERSNLTTEDNNLTAEKSDIMANNPPYDTWTSEAKQNRINQINTRQIIIANRQNEITDRETVINDTISENNTTIGDYTTELPKHSKDGDITIDAGTEYKSASEQFYAGLINKLLTDEAVDDPDLIKAKAKLAKKIENGTLSPQDVVDMLIKDGVLGKLQTMYGDEVFASITGVPKPASKDKILTVFPVPTKEGDLSSTKLTAFKSIDYSSLDKAKHPDLDLRNKLMGPVLKNGYEQFMKFSAFPPHITRDEFAALQSSYITYVRSYGKEGLPPGIEKLLSSYDRYQKNVEKYNAKFELMHEVLALPVGTIVKEYIRKDFALGKGPFSVEDITKDYISKVLAEMGITYPPLAGTTLTKEQEDLVRQVKNDALGVITGNLCTKKHDAFVKDIIKNSTTTPDASMVLAQDKIIREEMLLESKAEQARLGESNPAHKDRAAESVYETAMYGHYASVVAFLADVESGRVTPTAEQRKMLDELFAKDPSTGKYQQTVGPDGKVTYVLNDKVPVDTDKKQACLQIMRADELIRAESKINELNELKKHPVKNHRQIKQLEKELNGEYSADKGEKKKVKELGKPVVMWSSPKAQIKYYEKLLKAIERYKQCPASIPGLNEDVHKKLIQEHDKVRTDAERQQIRQDAKYIMFAEERARVQNEINNHKALSKQRADADIIEQLESALGRKLTSTELAAVQTAGSTPPYGIVDYDKLTPEVRKAIEMRDARNKAIQACYAGGYTFPLPTNISDALNEDNPDFGNPPLDKPPFDTMKKGDACNFVKAENERISRLKDMDKNLEVLCDKTKREALTNEKTTLKGEIINDITAALGRPLTPAETAALSLDKIDADRFDLYELIPDPAVRKTLYNKIKRHNDLTGNETYGDEMMGEIYSVVNIELGDMYHGTWVTNSENIDIAHGLDGSKMSDYEEIAEDLRAAGITDVEAAIASKGSLDNVIASLPAGDIQTRLLAKKKKLDQRLAKNPYIVGEVLEIDSHVDEAEKKAPKDLGKDDEGMDR